MICDYKREFLNALAFYRGKGEWKGPLYLDSADEADYAEQFYLLEFEKAEREMAAHLGEPGSDKSVVGRQMRYTGIDKLVERTAKAIPKGALPLDGLALRVSINRILYLYAQWHLAHPEYSQNEGWTVLPDITRTKYCSYVLAKTWAAVSPEHLQDEIERAFGSRYDRELGANLRPISALWLSFAGVTSRELYAAKNNDLDLDCTKQTGTILVRRSAGLGGEQRLPLEPASIECLYSLKTTDYLTTYGKHDIQRVGGDSFLRGIQTHGKGVSQPVPTMQEDYTRISRYLSLLFDGQIMDNSILYLSHSGAYRSGFYYRAYLEEQSVTSKDGGTLKKPRTKRIEKNLKTLDLMIDLWFDELKRQGKTFDDDFKKSKTESRKRLAVYRDYDAWKYLRQSKEMGP